MAYFLEGLRIGRRILAWAILSIQSGEVMLSAAYTKGHVSNVRAVGTEASYYCH